MHFQHYGVDVAVETESVPPLHTNDNTDDGATDSDSSAGPGGGSADRVSGSDGRCDKAAARAGACAGVAGQRLRPYLLEVNKGPDMNTIREDVRAGLADGIWQLVGTHGPVEGLASPPEQFALVHRPAGGDAAATPTDEQEEACFDLATDVGVAPQERQVHE